MTKKIGILFASGLAAFALLVFIIIKVLPISSIWAESLSEQEIRDKVSRQYGGEIVDFMQQDNQFAVQLKQETGIYKLYVDAKSGEVISLRQVDRNDSPEPGTPSDPLTPHDESQQPSGEDLLDQPNEHGNDQPNVPNNVNNVNNGNNTNTGNNPTNNEGLSPQQPSEETPTPRPSRISANEAAQIAVNEIGGVVEDVDLEEIGGTYYYLVEIEFDDDDDQEAEVQIDVLTGEIISIVWDD